MDKNYEFITFISKQLYFKIYLRPNVTIFGDIIKTLFEDSKTGQKK